MGVVQAKGEALLVPRRGAESSGEASEVLCVGERAPPRSCGRATEGPGEDDYERMPDARGDPRGVEPPQGLARGGDPLREPP